MSSSLSSASTRRRWWVVLLLAAALPLGGIPASASVDADGDGWTVEQGDCDDHDPQVNPAAYEAPDGKDNDCDGQIDEGSSVLTYRDADGDGWGHAGDTRDAIYHHGSNGYTAEPGYVFVAGDCDDHDATVYPGATELADGRDNDCDGTVDEGAVGVGRWYADADSDGYGDPSVSVEAVERPMGYVSNAGDCDDSDPAVNPGATELADGKDNDCDGLIDEGITDTDGDGLADDTERDLGTDPSSDDTDGDGIRDGEETDGGARVDTDRDGVIDARDTDSDNDAVPDAEEGAVDTDGDGVPDYRDVDSDDDGVTDRVDNCRVVQNLRQEDLDEDGRGDVCDADDDNDGLSDADEAERGTDPRDPDSDDDGLNDAEEALAIGSDPRDADTDGDLASDRTEVAAGSDPTNPLSVPLPPDGSVTITKNPPVREVPVTDDQAPLY